MMWFTINLRSTHKSLWVVDRYNIATRFAKKYEYNKLKIQTDKYLPMVIYDYNVYITTILTKEY